MDSLQEGNRDSRGVRGWGITETQFIEYHHNDILQSMREFKKKKLKRKEKETTDCLIVIDNHGHKMASSARCLGCVVPHAVLPPLPVLWLRALGVLLSWGDSVFWAHGAS